MLLVNEIGFGEVRLPVTKEETGAAFYPKEDKLIAFQSGQTVLVEAGTNTIRDALDNSSPGDTLVLNNDEEYLLTKYAFVKHPVTIRAESGAQPVLRSEKSSFFIIENGGALELENLWGGYWDRHISSKNVGYWDRHCMRRWDRHI